MIDVRERLAVTIRGDGDKTLVLGNGFCTDATSWDAITASVPRDWRVVSFQYVGNPSTPPDAWDPQRYSSLRGHAADVVELLATLDLRGVLFLGHSMSGMVGSLAQIQVPDRFGEIAAISASPCYVDIPGEYVGGFSTAQIDESLALADADLAAWMAGFAPAMLGDEAPAESIRAYSRHILQMRPDIARLMLRSIFQSDFRDILPQVSCPVTILQPKRDVGVPLAVGAYLAGHIPRATLRVLDVTGHSPHITHPQVVIDVLRDVLVRFSERRARALGRRH